MVIQPAIDEAAARETTESRPAEAERTSLSDFMHGPSTAVRKQPPPDAYAILVQYAFAQARSIVPAERANARLLDHDPRTSQVARLPGRGCRSGLRKNGTSWRLGLRPAATRENHFA
jgi:hypothetical protein